MHTSKIIFCGVDHAGLFKSKVFHEMNVHHSVIWESKAEICAKNFSKPVSSLIHFLLNQRVVELLKSDCLAGFWNLYTGSFYSVYSRSPISKPAKICSTFFFCNILTLQNIAEWRGKNIGINLLFIWSGEILGTTTKWVFLSDQQLCDKVEHVKISKPNKTGSASSFDVVKPAVSES